MDGGGDSSVGKGRNCKSDTILVGGIADHLPLPGDALPDHRHEEFRIREFATEVTNSRGELEEEPNEQRQEELHPEQDQQQRHQPHQQTQQRQREQNEQQNQQHKQQQHQQGRRAFCVECHKATSVCICDRFGDPVDNRVGITILQHPKEKYHPLGSARIALLGLQRVRVVVVPLGRGRPGLQPKDPCSRRSLMGRSGRGRWRKGAGKTQGQGGKQGEGPGDEQRKGQGNGQEHGHGVDQGDVVASTGRDGRLVVVTAVGEKGVESGGELGEGEGSEGEVIEGEKCEENGVEREGSKVGETREAVLDEKQGGEKANGATTGDSSSYLSFDLLPFAAADGADSDDGAGVFGGDYDAEGSSEDRGGGVCSQDNTEFGINELASTACGDGCCDDSSCSCSKGRRSSGMKSKSTGSKSRRINSSSWRVVPEEFAVDNRHLRMSLLHSNHSTSSINHSSSSNGGSSSSTGLSNQVNRMPAEDRVNSTSNATSTSSFGSTQAVNAGPEEIPEWISLPPGAAVLYPSPRSIELQSPQPSNSAERSAPSIGDQSSDVLRPSHLIVLDGTWPKAKRILCQNPWLLQLPHYHLPPHAAAPSRYGFIRKQPKFGCMSTIEAVVYALQILEPDNRVKLDQLLEVFNSMVIDQVEGMRRNGKSSLIPDDWIAPGKITTIV